MGDREFSDLEWLKWAIAQRAPTRHVERWFVVIWARSL
jgi:hypothetical protein